MKRFTGLVVMGYLFSLFLFAKEAVAMASQAEVVKILGEAKFLKKDAAEWQFLEKGMILSEGDAVRTAQNSLVTLQLKGADKTAEVVIKPESEFSFQTFTHDESKGTQNTRLNVEIGSVLVKAEKLVGDSNFEVKTPTSVVGIRGTIFEVQVSKS